MSPRLYSYCIPTDDGAAPNPFWGLCTLVICKPAIRRTAQVGDWVVGTGAKGAKTGTAPDRDMSGKLVYAMKVTQKMTLAEYDEHTRTRLRKKIPNRTATDHRLRLGDSLYDYKKGSPVQRPGGVHNEGNIRLDLSGGYALLSSHFWYFGAEAIELPKRLRPIAQNQQGHRVTLNEPYVDDFVRWVGTWTWAAGSLLGNPLCDLFAPGTGHGCGGCATGQAEKDDPEQIEELRDEA